jgi:hypothetical protein
MKELIRESIEKSISYEDYRSKVTELVAEGKTTGPRQTEELVEFTRINNQRMRRLEKTIQLDEELIHSVRAIDQPQIWLLLTEGWCGDAAQIIPIIDKAARFYRNVDLGLLLRDENLELMDQFLTDGGRSIPKLIILNAETYELLGCWGPRPKSAQELQRSLKNLGIPGPEIKLRIQKWYNQDKTHQLQKELRELLYDINMEAVPVNC